MKRKFHHIVSSVLLFGCLSVCAVAAEEPTAEQPAAVHINVTVGDLKVEIEGLDRTLATAEESLARVTMSLQRLSERDDLSAEELQLISSAVTELSRSVNKVADAANNLPESIQKSQQPIKVIADDFMASARMTLLLALLGVLVLLAVGLFLIYHYVFKPVKAIAQNMERVSDSVEKTVKAASQFEKLSNERHSDLPAK